MKPIRTPESNGTFELVGGTRANDLPVCHTVAENGYPVIVSTWALDDDERARVAAGAPIELVVWGAGTPPVAMHVRGEDEAPL